MPTAVEPRLTPERVVDVAHELISRHGLGWFSMRKLATALGVNPMTVYLRFDSKDDLLAAVAARGVADLRLPEPPEGTWSDRALTLATSLRVHLLSDRNLLGLYAAVGRMSGVVLQATEQGLSLMEEAGYRQESAVLAFRSLFWHTVGFTLVEHQFDGFPADGEGGLEDTVGPVDPAAHPTFARTLPAFTPVDADALFEHTTRALVAGLAAAAPNPPSTGRTP